MKKILSLFLASLMLLSLFTGITVFAANSQTDNYGGTLWHKWDFESDTKDIINNASPADLTPVVYSDATKGNVGKIAYPGGNPKNTAKIATFNSPGVGDSQDRYIVAELDFKRDASDVNYYFRWRDTQNNKNLGVYSWDKTSTNGWVHLIFVVDTVANPSGKYDVSVFKMTDGIYTKLSNPSYNTMTVLEGVKFGQFRMELGSTSDAAYIDNLELKRYQDFYNAINDAQSAEIVVNIIDRYVGLGLASVPTEYNNLTSAKKLSVAEKLINQNFASDSAVATEISTILTDEVFEKVYFDWNFEDGTINDSVNGEPFMSEYSVAALPLSIKAVQDPINAANQVAVMSDGYWANASYGQILTYTDVVDDALAADEFDYLTFEFKVYGDQNNNFPVYLQIRDKSASNKFYIINANKAGRTWHQFKSVVNIPENTVTTYALENGVWNQVKNISLPSTFGFYRFEFIKAGTACTTYYDDFKVTGYKSVVTEVNEASVNGVLSALETADSLGVISLPAAYTSLDDAGKAAFAASVKSATYTSAQQIQEAITIYFSTDDLVLLSSANDANGKLDSLKLYVKKDGVNLATSEIFVAAYKDGELTGLASCPQEAAVATGATVTLTGLALDVASATEAKVILVNNLTDLTPAVKAINLK